MGIGLYEQVVIYSVFGIIVIAGVITILIDPKRRVRAGEYGVALLWCRICWYGNLICLGLTMGLLFRGLHGWLVWFAISILGWVLWRDGAFIEEIKQRRNTDSKPKDDPDA